MNKVAAVQIATLIKQAGLTPTQAILLVKAAHDAANVKARMEKTANQLKRLWSARHEFLRPGANKIQIKPLTGPTNIPVPPPKPGMPAPNANGMLPQSPTSTASSSGGLYDDVMASFPKRTLPQSAAVPIPPVSTPATPPFSPKKGWSNMGRLRAAAGLGGGVVVGAGHIDNAMDNSAYLSPEDRFLRNQKKVDYELDRGGLFEKSLRQQMEEAKNKGDMATYAALNEKLQSGDFGGSSFSLWGANPFANRKAKGYMDRASVEQKSLQDKYNAEMGSVGVTPETTARVAKLTEQLNSGRLSKPQAEALDTELALLKQRMEMKPGDTPDTAAKIKARMDSAGMGFVPWKAPGATKPTTTTPGGAWNTAGPRPGGYGQGFANSRYDFRPQPQRDPWESVLSNNNSIFGG